MGFLRSPLQHQTGSLWIEDFLVHLLTKPAEFDRNDGKWILSRHHADGVGAFHPLTVHELVVLLRVVVSPPHR